MKIPYDSPDMQVITFLASQKIAVLEDNPDEQTPAVANDIITDSTHYDDGIRPF